MGWLMSDDIADSFVDAINLGFVFDRKIQTNASTISIVTIAIENIYI